ncbi:MAG: DinB family protein [Chloroflexi bacterium]|nr:DinB family protein [Chloroflexota bacterium]
MILAQNRATRGDLLAELLGLSDEELNRQPAPEEWSVRQVLEHAIEVERRYLAAAEKALAEAKAGQG